MREIFSFSIDCLQLRVFRFWCNTRIHKGKTKQKETNLIVCNIKDPEEESKKKNYLPASVFSYLAQLYLYKWAWLVWLVQTAPVGLI